LLQTNDLCRGRWLGISNCDAG